MPFLNLGIVAHVDAGKTSLTERLLHHAGVIDELGSVDAGSTQTDTLALERRRGITIKSAVATFALGDVTVNLIDTPGHPDFIAEVERSLGVLDGAVLVVSAVEGVQAQTRVLMRTLARLGLPTLIFINKTDRRGADPERVARELPAKLRIAAAPVGSSALADLLADHDDRFLAAYLNGAAPVWEELARQTRRALVYPVFRGSAITGAGIDALARGLRELLPAGRAGGPATVFKVERGAAGERIAYVRGGTLRLRQPVGDSRVTAISVFTPGGTEWRDALAPGEIGKVHGLADVRIGDRIGADAASGPQLFAPPTLETVVEADDRVALHAALTELAEQDPLINLHRVGEALAVSLYGEVQKQAIEATLADDYGLTVRFRETTAIRFARPAGTGAAVERIGENEHLATVGLRVAPGDGVTFALEVELGSMPYAFFRAVEETVRASLRVWRVTDCAVTMTHSGYWARQSSAHGTFDKSVSSTARDFRLLTPRVLRDALEQAGTIVLEPLAAFRLECPPDTLAAVLPVLGRLGGAPSGGDERALEGEIPVAGVHALQLQLPALTRGEGVLETTFSRYTEVRS